VITKKLCGFIGLELVIRTGNKIGMEGPRYNFSLKKFTYPPTSITWTRLPTFTKWDFYSLGSVPVLLAHSMERLVIN
jgi:hypothetical protein